METSYKPFGTPYKQVPKQDPEAGSDRTDLTLCHSPALSDLGLFGMQVLPIEGLDDTIQTVHSSRKLFSTRAALHWV
jgi:hypothetical protein